MTERDIIDELRMHPKDETPWVCMRAVLEIQRLRAAEKELRAIVDRLEKTEDGVPITPAMRLYDEGGEQFYVEKDCYLMDENGAVGWRAGTKVFSKPPARS